MTVPTTTRELRELFADYEYPRQRIPRGLPAGMLVEPGARAAQRRPDVPDGNGRGFALVGRQFPLRVVDEETGEESEFFLDLLFYNYILRRFLVIDLKIEDFKPEFAGKMNFYLNAVDQLERQPDDEPAIGLVLCPGRNKTVTQWALRGMDTPVAVARYTTGDVTMTDETPATLRPALPELPELATELTGITDAADILYDDEHPEDVP